MQKAFHSDVCICAFHLLRVHRNRMTIPLSLPPSGGRLWRCIRSYLLSELLLPFFVYLSTPIAKLPVRFRLGECGIGICVTEVPLSPKFFCASAAALIVPPHLSSTQNYNHLLPLKIVLFYYGKRLVRKQRSRGLDQCSGPW